VKRTIALLVLAGVLVAACGDDDAGDATEPTTADQPGDAVLPPDPGGDDAGQTMLAPSGPPLTVAEALEAAEGESFIVTGFLFVSADGSLVLADLIAESYPPQPAGAQVPVVGLDLQTVPLTEGPEDVEIAVTAWTDLPIELFGSIDGGVFRGATLAAS
jgi:hypothetical protein